MFGGACGNLRLGEGRACLDHRSSKRTAPGEDSVSRLLVVADRAGAVDSQRLVGIWFHAFEEDEGGRRVYRDQSYEVPLSRAPRLSLVHESDGSSAECAGNVG